MLFRSSSSFVIVLSVLDAAAFAVESPRMHALILSLVGYPVFTLSMFSNFHNLTAMSISKGELVGLGQKFDCSCFLSAFTRQRLHIVFLSFIRTL